MELKYALLLYNYVRKSANIAKNEYKYTTTVTPRQNSIAFSFFHPSLKTTWSSRLGYPS